MPAGVLGLRTMVTGRLPAASPISWARAPTTHHDFARLRTQEVIEGATYDRAPSKGMSSLFRPMRSDLSGSQQDSETRGCFWCS